MSAAGSAVVYLKLVLGHDTVFGLVRKFDLDTELNVPTWFSVLLLLLAAAALGYIGVRAKHEGDRFAGHWRGLAWIFLFMSLDETATAKLRDRLRSAGRTQKKKPTGRKRAKGERR